MTDGWQDAVSRPLSPGASEATTIADADATVAAGRCV